MVSWQVPAWEKCTLVQYGRGEAEGGNNIISYHVYKKKIFTMPCQEFCRHWDVCKIKTREHADWHCWWKLGSDGDQVATFEGVAPHCLEGILPNLLWKEPPLQKQIRVSRQYERRKFAGIVTVIWHGITFVRKQCMVEGPSLPPPLPHPIHNPGFPTWWLVNSHWSLHWDLV